MDEEQVKKELVGFLPSSVALVFGDPVTKVIAGISLFSRGAIKLMERNKSWLDKLTTNNDVIEHFDFMMKTPEFIQYLREVLTQVAFEAREKRRENLLNASWNYYLKDDKFTFDEKMMLIRLLDQLSVLEVSYMIGYYSKQEIPPEIFRMALELNVPNKLSSLGLLDSDYSSI